MKQSTEVLFRRFLDNQCSPEEVKDLFNRIDLGQYPKHLEPVLDQYWEQLGDHSALTKEHGDQLLSLLKARIKHQNSSGKNGFTAWRIAASVALLIGITILGFTYVKSFHNQPVADYITKRTVSGQKSTIMLDDGTVVKLNAESKIMYTAELGAKKREVILEGEAFFEVNPDPSRPFIIDTRDIRTTVLGTSFDIRAFPNEEIAVTVATGKVRVSSEAGEVHLVTGEQARYHPTSGLKKCAVEINHFTAWKDGIIDFVDASEAEVLARLARWYGVSFEVKGEHDQSWKINAHYQEKSLEFVLNSLRYSVGFEYQLTEDKVSIQFDVESKSEAM